MKKKRLARERGYIMESVNFRNENETSIFRRKKEREREERQAHQSNELISISLSLEPRKVESLVRILLSFSLIYTYIRRESHRFPALGYLYRIYSRLLSLLVWLTRADVVLLSLSGCILKVSARESIYKVRAEALRPRFKVYFLNYKPNGEVMRQPKRIAYTLQLLLYCGRVEWKWQAIQYNCFVAVQCELFCL